MDGYKSEKTLFLYGHLDKTTPLSEEWSKGQSPYKKGQVTENHVYGRGVSDTFWNLYSMVKIIQNLNSKSLKMPRIYMLFETEFHKGSP